MPTKSHQLTCPHCHQVFDIDESGYANLLSQISRQEIDQEVHEKLAAATRAQALEHEAALTKLRSESSEALTKLKSEHSESLTKLEAAKDAELSRLKSEKDAALSKLQADKDAELANLRAKLDSAEKSAETAQELAVTKAVAATRQAQDEEINQLKLELQRSNDTVEYYKDLKARLSTKMIGETLEQHCETQFNQLRATAFQHAYFEKDNLVSKASGSKGDYIFRECDAAGNEIISIMFEMKNENETTATKHKNEDFLKELDKDRREKNCEYAVLVSMLEADSELYNTGIVDVSYKYEKMYVIRPQFFIPMITLLRNAALNSLQYKAELAAVREQNIDITNFEERINTWKESFNSNSKKASDNFVKAIKEIDKSIESLEKTRKALLLTVKNFDVANKKLDDLTVKKLTRGNVTMTEMFANLKDDLEEEL